MARSGERRSPEDVIPSGRWLQALGASWVLILNGWALSLTGVGAARSLIAGVIRCERVWFSAGEGVFGRMWGGVRQQRAELRTPIDPRATRARWTQWAASLRASQALPFRASSAPDIRRSSRCRAISS